MIERNSIVQSLLPDKYTLLSLPPAFTLLGQISLLFFLGPFSEWLQTHWFPFTRAMWDTVFSWIGVIDLSVKSKDYLTAIVFFVPAYLLTRRSASSEPQAARGLKLVACIVGGMVIYLLANDSLSDLKLIADSVLAIYFVLCGLFLFVLLLRLYERMIATPLPEEFAGTAGTWDVKYHVFRLFMIVMLIVLGAAIVYDVLMMFAHDFPPEDQNPFYNFFSQAVPVRSGLFGLVIFFVALFSAPPTARARLKKNESEAEKGKLLQNPLKLRWVLPVVLIVPAGLYSLLALSVGWVETGLFLLLVWIVVSIALRAPMRIVSIGKATLVLLGSTYVIWGIQILRNFIETMSQLASLAT